MTIRITGTRGSVITIGNTLPITIIAGPCQIENKDSALRHAVYLNNLCGALNLNFIYKSSFDKANRTNKRSARGVGLVEGLEILSAVKREIGCPVVTDVHSIEQVLPVSEVVDVIQIPALLSRQTDLIAEAGSTGRVVMIKKGQFMAPDSVYQAADKAVMDWDPRPDRVMVCERGTSFGHNDLVVDYRGLKTMKNGNWLPVVFDATHSVQSPAGLGSSSGGQREFVETLTRAAVAVGIAGLFIECHENPDAAPSDGPCMMPLGRMDKLLERVRKIDDLVKSSKF